jgi:hypothetical protein
VSGGRLDTSGRPPTCQPAKTIRRYIREQRLKAKRIGKEYRITPADLEAFAGRGAADAPVTRTREMIASTIVDIHAIISAGESHRITTMIVAGLNAKRGEPDAPRVDTIYYAVRRPDRVGALSLLSPAGIGRQNHLFHVPAVLLMALGPRGVRKALKLAAGGADVPSGAATFVMMVFRHFRPRMANVPLRTDEELARPTMPVRVILGGKDRLLRSDETRDRLTRLLPQVHRT